MRVLASSEYAQAQRFFAGLAPKDATDTNLQLTYGIETLWEHCYTEIDHRLVSTLKCCPYNSYLIAAGYTSYLDSVSKHKLFNGYMEGKLNIKIRLKNVLYWL